MHYVGTYVAWGSHSNGWWAEGEVKFYVDGDDGWPVITGTGTEGYFLGLYNFYGQWLVPGAHNPLLWPAPGDHS